MATKFWPIEYCLYFSVVRYHELDILPTKYLHHSVHLILVLFWYDIPFLSLRICRMFANLFTRQCFIKIFSLFFDDIFLNITIDSDTIFSAQIKLNSGHIYSIISSWQLLEIMFIGIDTPFYLLRSIVKAYVKTSWPSNRTTDILSSSLRQYFWNPYLLLNSSSEKTDNSRKSGE